MKTPLILLLDIIQDCETYSELIYFIDKNRDEMIEAEKQMIIEAVKHGIKLPEAQIVTAPKLLALNYYKSITEG